MLRAGAGDPGVSTSISPVPAHTLRVRYRALTFLTFVYGRIKHNYGACWHRYPERYDTRVTQLLDTTVYVSVLAIYQVWLNGITMVPGRCGALEQEAREIPPGNSRETREADQATRRTDCTSEHGYRRHNSSTKRILCQQ